MLQSARFTAITVSELLRERRQGVKIPPTQISFNVDNLIKVSSRCTLDKKLDIT